MTESRRPYGAPQPEPIDDDQDRMGSMEELHFDDQDNDIRSGRPGQPTDDGSTDDDLSPETLIREDGARSARETGCGKPADWDLSIVEEAQIGGGNGLDEAELARRDPLDGKP